MRPFATALRQSADQKSQEDDLSDDNGSSLSPLLADSNSRNSTSLTAADTTTLPSQEETFSLRVKLNDGHSQDYTLDNVNAKLGTVGMLKERILGCYFGEESGANSGSVGGGGLRELGSLLDTSSNNHPSFHASKNRYLRLIVRGRMMAPDSSTLEKFSITKNDVIHAVLAKEGVRGGQQARMLRRLNTGNTVSGRSNYYGGSGGDGENNSSAVVGGGALRQFTTAATSTLTPSLSDNSLTNRLMRRIGIDANGVVISQSQDDDDSEDDEDFDDVHGELDEEMGGQHHQQQRHHEDRSGSRRRIRERRGFDRLRATGMSRDEVNTIRLYFARSVDSYIQRRRVMIRASQMIRNRRNGRSGNTDVATDGEGATRSTSGDEHHLSALTSSRQRSETGESANSLLDDGEGGSGANVVESEHGADVLTANAGNAGEDDTANNENNTPAVEGEEILLDRRRMEDEWMSTQGPYSEFRMNLNTSNPLLLAAISGGNTPTNNNANTAGRSFASGLFFRRGGTLSNNPTGMTLDGEEEDEEDLMFGGTIGPNGTFVRTTNPNGPFHPYSMGPVPSAGTDKDFLWGFILGFFVGFIMLFWVWMPTVPHKQKIGIISGISFQLGLNLLRKSGQEGVAM